MPLKKDIKLVRSLRQKKFRNEYGLFTAEGRKMVDEGLASSFRLHSLYSTDESFLPEKCIKLNSREMEMISSLSTPSAHLAVFHKKEQALPTRLSGHILVLDGIADPGNMGTIIRSAEWFGISAVFCTDDCVELYNPKTVQATMGSLFRMGVHSAPAVEIINLLKTSGYYLLGADMKGTSIYEAAFGKKQAIVIGSESHGLRDTMKNAIDEYITIPGAGGAESLNASVAASVILSELYRRVSSK